MPKGERKLKIAIYMRLSREDASAQGESGSIRTQRMLLRGYAAAHFDNYEILEYEDV